MRAAGGVGDGRTLAAVLQAGADGARLGTAFPATPEAVEVHDAHERLVAESDGGDTVWDAGPRHRAGPVLAGGHR